MSVSNVDPLDGIPSIAMEIQKKLEKSLCRYSFKGTKEEALRLSREILDQGDTDQFSDVAYFAIKYGDVELLKKVVDTGYLDPYGRDEELILDACCHNNLELIEFMEDHGWCIYTTSYIGWTTLMSACCHGHLEVVKYLLYFDVDLDALADGQTALGVASANGLTEIVQFLINAQCDINEHGENQSLWEASKNGHENIVQILIQNGVNVNKKEKCYALVAAAKGGHLKIVQILIQNGAKVNQESDRPLENAVEYGHLNIVKILVNAGAHSKKSLIQIAVEKNYHLIAIFLMESGCEINSFLKFDATLNEAILNRQQYFEQIEHIIKTAPVFAYEDPNVPNLIFQFSCFYTMLMNLSRRLFQPMEKN